MPPEFSPEMARELAQAAGRFANRVEAITDGHGVEAAASVIVALCRARRVPRDVLINLIENFYDRSEAELEAEAALLTADIHSPRVLS